VSACGCLQLLEVPILALAFFLFLEDIQLLLSGVLGFSEFLVFGIV
jgi:hypothetical protein